MTLILGKQVVRTAAGMWNSCLCREVMGSKEFDFKWSRQWWMRERHLLHNRGRLCHTSMVRKCTPFWDDLGCGGIPREGGGAADLAIG